jgi:hypothetical protein
MFVVGLTATPEGEVPTLMVALTVFVVSITETEAPFTFAT